ncbi:Uncharacterised protein [Shigella sonnei]|nr:Uncharacterised protein [Shigella sonnei]CSI15403.1 Uncharacterised protein [Shigella sonnei]
MRFITVRAILFFRLFFTGEVQLRRDLGVNITVTNNRRQDCFNTPLNTAFDIAGIFQLSVIKIAPAGIGLG